MSTVDLKLDAINKQIDDIEAISTHDIIQIQNKIGQIFEELGELEEKVEQQGEMKLRNKYESLKNRIQVFKSTINSTPFDLKAEEKVEKTPESMNASISTPSKEPRQNMSLNLSNVVPRLALSNVSTATDPADRFAEGSDQLMRKKANRDSKIDEAKKSIEENLEKFEKISNKKELKSILTATNKLLIRLENIFKQKITHIEPVEWFYLQSVSNKVLETVKKLKINNNNYNQCFANLSVYIKNSRLNDSDITALETKLDDIKDKNNSTKTITKIDKDERENISAILSEIQARINIMERLLGITSENNSITPKTCKLHEDCVNQLSALKLRGQKINIEIDAFKVLFKTISHAHQLQIYHEFINPQNSNSLISRGNKKIEEVNRDLTTYIKDQMHKNSALTEQQITSEIMDPQNNELIKIISNLKVGLMHIDKSYIDLQLAETLAKRLLTWINGTVKAFDAKLTQEEVKSIILTEDLQGMLDTQEDVSTRLEGEARKALINMVPKIFRDLRNNEE